MNKMHSNNGVPSTGEQPSLAALARKSKNELSDEEVARLKAAPAGDLSRVVEYASQAPVNSSILKLVADTAIERATQISNTRDPSVAIEVAQLGKVAHTATDALDDAMFGRNPEQ